MQVTSDRMRKGQQKMRALADATSRFYFACSHATGRLYPGPTLEVDHIDSVLNALDDAIVVIRTLDLEVLEASDPHGYTAIRKTSLKGTVVRALTAPRNNAIHHAEVIDPDLARAIGPLENGRCIIFPKWKPRSALPRAMFQYAQGKKKGQDRLNHMASYDAAAAGRLVLDTIMDAFSFFDTCDSRLADRDDEGNLIGFPLAPLPVPGYMRLAPDWPDQETVDLYIRDRVRTEVPAGTGREITGRLSTPAGTVYCGYTSVDASRRHSFTEGDEQVRREIELGYPYVAVAGSRRLPVAVVDDELHAGGVPLERLFAMKQGGQFA